MKEPAFPSYLSLPQTVPQSSSIDGARQFESKKKAITKVKPKPPKRAGKLESMFKNSQRENFFVPSTSFGEVHGKHLSVNFPFNSYNHCIYVCKMYCYVTVNVNICTCT